MQALPIGYGLRNINTPCPAHADFHRVLNQFFSRHVYAYARPEPHGERAPRPSEWPAVFSKLKRGGIPREMLRRFLELNDVPRRHGRRGFMSS